MPLIRHLRQRLTLFGIVCTRALISQVAVGAVALVRDDAGRVLLVGPRFGTGWSLPGGGVGAGEPPEQAVLRELREEVGLIDCKPPALVALYTRRVAWATNLIVLYDVADARIAFKPNLEIREICWADPASPPRHIQLGAARRLAELTGRLPRQMRW